MCQALQAPVHTPVVGDDSCTVLLLCQQLLLLPHARRLVTEAVREAHITAAAAGATISHIISSGKVVIPLTITCPQQIPSHNMAYGIWPLHHNSRQLLLSCLEGNNCRCLSALPQGLSACCPSPPPRWPRHLPRGSGPSQPHPAHQPKLCNNMLAACPHNMQCLHSTNADKSPPVTNDHSCWELLSSSQSDARYSPPAGGDLLHLSSRPHRPPGLLEHLQEPVSHLTKSAQGVIHTCRQHPAPIITLMESAGATRLSAALRFSSPPPARLDHVSG